MTELKVQEQGKNWLHKSPAILLILCIGGIDLFIVVMSLLNLGEGKSPMPMLFFGLFFILLPFLPAALKEPVDWFFITDEEGLTIRKQEENQLTAKWSEIKSVTVLPINKNICISYTDKDKRNKYYNITTTFLSKIDMAKIALLLGEHLYSQDKS